MTFKIPETISEEEFIQIIKSVKKLKTKLIYLLMFYQCLRVSEVVNLKPEDIQNCFIHIKQGKGKKDRHIPVMEEVKFFLRYLPIKISRQAIHKSIKKIGKKILNKNLHPHTLRHSGASMYLNDRRIDIRFIQEFLGHSRLSTTQIYTHVNPQQLKNAFENASKKPIM